MDSHDRLCALLVSGWRIITTGRRRLINASVIAIRNLSAGVETDEDASHDGADYKQTPLFVDLFASHASAG